MRSTLRYRRPAALLVAAAVVTAPTHGATATVAPVPVAVVRAEDGLWSLDAAGWPAAPSVDAAAWILVDVTTGQVLGGRDEDVPRPPASTTKLLTALAVSRRTAPDDVVVVPEAAVGIEGATAGLRAGQRIRVDDLLALLLLRSGNDAAAALAIHVGGSPDGFARLLRAEADVLGLRDAVVVEPHGLHDGNRLSARSLAVIGRAVLADPALRPLVAAQTWRLSDGTTIANRNELLAAYPASTGLKTGMTRAAGWSLVASARRGQRHLVAVVLGGPTADSRFTASEVLLQHGFLDFAPAPAPPRLRVREDARWLRLRPTGPEGLLPLGAVADLVPSLPVEPVAPTVRWSWGGGDGTWLQPTTLVGEGARATTAPVSDVPDGASRRRTPADTGAAGLGAWLSGRVQAGMRAATLADLWP